MQIFSNYDKMYESFTFKDLSTLNKGFENALEINS